MRKVVLFGKKRGAMRPTSFTLIELLVVMAIIIILVSITLWAAQALWVKAARSRAQAEITAISADLESYKADNGIYPQATNVLGGTIGNYPVNPAGSSITSYQAASQILFECIAGKTNYNDTAAASRVYASFKISQLGNYTTTAGTGYALTTATYLQDPWSYPYGYSTGDGTSNNIPCNGSNFFDLWTTAGQNTLYINGATTGNTYSTNMWISNWRSQ